MSINLVNEGGFGCLYFPSINCDGSKSNDKNSISKLQLINFNSINEIYIGKLIQKIPNFQLFFRPTLSFCKLNIGNLQDKKFKDCNLINGLNHNKNFMLTNQFYIDSVSFNQIFLEYIKYPGYQFLIFIETYRYLLYSLDLLVINKIIHMDIKKQNILYSKSVKNPILIDFGISIPIEKVNKKNIKKYFYVFAPKYSIWALEIHFINYLLHKGELNESKVKDILNEYYENNSAFSLFSDDFKQNYILAGFNYYKQFIGKSKEYTVNYLMKYYYTWDLFSLSILYLNFLTSLSKDSLYSSLLISKFLELLLTNIFPNPERRYDTKNSLNAFQRVFYIGDSISEYKSLIENLKYSNLIL